MMTVFIAVKSDFVYDEFGTYDDEDGRCSYEDGRRCHENGHRRNEVPGFSKIALIFLPVSVWLPGLGSNIQFSES